MATTYITDSAGRPVIDKDPDAILDYTIDWVDYLADIADTILNFSVTATGVTVVSATQAGSQVTAWLSGGTEGAKVMVTYQITTVSGRRDDRSIYLKIKQR